MIIRIVLALLLLASCSKSPDIKVARTLQVSAERLAEIRSNPHRKRSPRDSAPGARISGLAGDAWPPGILFYGWAMDPYLEELGFTTSTLIVAINGKKVHDIFNSRWRRHGRLGGFYPANYQDLIEYLFLENKWDQFVVTVYVDVPGDATEVPSYAPKIEHWRIRLK